MTSKQETLFDMKRKRNQNTYKNTVSRDGSLSVIIDPEIAERVRRYCQIKNLNCKKVVNEMIEMMIGELENTLIDTMSPDQMRDLLRKMSPEEIGNLLSRRKGGSNA